MDDPQHAHENIRFRENDKIDSVSGRADILAVLRAKPVSTRVLADPTRRGEELGAEALRAIRIVTRDVVGNLVRIVVRFGRDLDPLHAARRLAFSMVRRNRASSSSIVISGLGSSSASRTFARTRAVCAAFGPGSACQSSIRSRTKSSADGQPSARAASRTARATSGASSIVIVSMRAGYVIRRSMSSSTVGSVPRRSALRTRGDPVGTLPSWA